MKKWNYSPAATRRQRNAADIINGAEDFLRSTGALDEWSLDRATIDALGVLRQAMVAVNSEFEMVQRAARLTS